METSMEFRVHDPQTGTVVPAILVEGRYTGTSEWFQVLVPPSCWAPGRPYLLFNSAVPVEAAAPKPAVPVEAAAPKPAEPVEAAAPKPAVPVEAAATNSAVPVEAAGTKPAVPVQAAGTKPAVPVEAAGTKPAEPSKKKAAGTKPTVPSKKKVVAFKPNGTRTTYAAAVRTGEEERSSVVVEWHFEVSVDGVKDFLDIYRDASEDTRIAYRAKVRETPERYHKLCAALEREIATLKEKQSILWAQQLKLYHRNAFVPRDKKQARKADLPTEDIKSDWDEDTIQRTLYHRAMDLLEYIKTELIPLRNELYEFGSECEIYLPK